MRTSTGSETVARDAADYLVLAARFAARARRRCRRGRMQARAALPL